jgi:hypothetical protein
MGNLKRKRSFDTSSSLASSPHAPSEHVFPPATFATVAGYSFSTMDVDDGSSAFAMARQEHTDVWWGEQSQMNFTYADASGRTKKRFRDGRPDEETIHRMLAYVKDEFVTNEQRQHIEQALLRTENRPPVVYRTKHTLSDGDECRTFLGR